MSGLVDTTVNATDSSRKINKREQQKLGKGAQAVKAGRGSKISIDGGSDKIAAIAKAAIAANSERAAPISSNAAGGLSLDDPKVIGLGILVLAVGAWAIWGRG